MIEKEKTNRQLFNALISVDKDTVFELFNTMFATEGSQHVANTLQENLEKIGQEWEKGNISLSQVYMSGIISEEAINNVLPTDYLTNRSLPKIGTAVFLDYHGLGMKIVSSLVRSAGYPVIDLGLGANIEDIIDFIAKENIKILLISVLMLPSALAVEELTLEISKRFPETKVVVGGAPFRLDENLGQKVGAHRTAKNAGEIFEILSQLERELI